MRVEFWAIEDVVGFFGSLQTEILNITRCAARQDGVSIVRIVSLLVLKNQSQKLIKPFIPEQQSLPVLYLHLYMYRWIDIIMIMVYNSRAITITFGQIHWVL